MPCPTDEAAAAIGADGLEKTFPSDTVSTLNVFGWDSAWAAQFESHRARGWVPGRVAVEDKHSYGVLTEFGPITAKVSGRLLHETRIRARLPKVGDWVALTPPAAGVQTHIHAVLPRRSALSRNDSGCPESEQVLAANVDLAFIVQALDQSFHLRRLERCLAMVRAGGVPAVVVLNKSDLCDHIRAAQAEAQQVADAVSVLCVSATKGTGLRQVSAHIAPGRTVVFLGPSGVGKSSLINSLYGEEVQATIEVREHDAKGRHTTTWRELIRLPCGGLVIDTPGLREFHVGLDENGLADLFPDLADLAVSCHFRNCSHTVEKRCAVLAALANGRVPRERFDRFQTVRLERDFLAVERRKHTFVPRR